MIQILKNYVHLLQAIAANAFYGFPSRRLTVVGVTGTDGKTTTTSLIYHILKTAGRRVAMISTVGAYIGDRVYDVGFHVTNPSPFPLQRFIRQVADAGNDFLVLEVTSHGLDQYRVWGIPFAVGVLTNITHEHLDYHKTFSAYVEAKGRLLVRAATCVVNMDDGSYGSVMELLRTTRQGPGSGHNRTVLTYSRTDAAADITPKTFPFASRLIGDFNVSNCLAAISAARNLGVSDKIIREALRSYSPPQGRQEVVYAGPFRVMVDFAHTPNAFSQVLPAVKRTTASRLIHVFGSAGKRDKSKRPKMGEAASRYADTIILTAEDPRDETVEEISSMIASGFGQAWHQVEPGSEMKPRSYVVIANRQQAITYAIGRARHGDTVLLTGKSHEKSMNYGRGEEPWDEYAAVRQALKVRSRSRR